MHNSGEQLRPFVPPPLAAPGSPDSDAEVLDRIDALFSLQIQEYQLRIAQLKAVSRTNLSAASGPDFVVSSRRAA